MADWTEPPLISFLFRHVLSLLSPPALLEIGANALGVCGGNEAVQTLLSDELLDGDGSPTKSLLGMDILRLALERGRTAREAVDVSIAMLEEYGQGGPCCREDADWTYENSFLFADSEEAYVLETAGRSHWCWERVGAGQVRNISDPIQLGGHFERHPKYLPPEFLVGWCIRLRLEEGRCLRWFGCRATVIRA